MLKLVGKRIIILLTVCRTVVIKIKGEISIVMRELLDSKKTTN